MEDHMCSTATINEWNTWLADCLNDSDVNTVRSKSGTLVGMSVHNCK